MSFAISYYEDHRVYHVRWDGDVTPEVVSDFYNKISKQEWFRPGLDGLHDLRGARISILQTDYPVLSEFERESGSNFGASRVANVVNSVKAHTLVTALGSGIDTDDHSRRKFRDLEEAKAWLGLPPDIHLD